MRNLSTRITQAVFLLFVIVTVFIAGCARENIVKAREGKEFTISLSAHGSSPVQWELAEPLDENILTLVGSEFKTVKKGSRQREKEVWTFKAVGKGQTTVAFRLRNVRTGEEEMMPGGKIDFPVSVR